MIDTIVSNRLPRSRALLAHGPLLAVLHKQKSRAGAVVRGALARDQVAGHGLPVGARQLSSLSVSDAT